MNKIQILSFVLILSLFFTTGCWDRTELNDLAIILGWGMDQTQDGTYMTSAQIVIPSKSGNSQGTGGSGQGKGYFVVTATGKSILDAAQNMQTKLSRHISASHRRVLFIGERLARNGLGGILDEYSRNPDTRLRSDIFVVKGGTAKDFLKTSYPLENIPVFGVLKEYNQLGALKETAFLDFLISATSEGSSSNLPAVAIDSDSSSQDGQDQEREDQSNEKGFRIAGTGIFDKDLKLIGFLNMDEARALRWVSGTLTRQTITTVVPQGKGNVSLDLMSMGSKIHPIIRGNQIKFDVMLSGKGNIRENNTNLDLMQSKNLTLVQNALDKQVQASILKTITKVQKEYGVDDFGFSDVIHRKYPYRWKSLKTNWEKEFPKTKIFVKANLTVLRVGLTGPSLQLKESEIKQ